VESEVNRKIIFAWLVFTGTACAAPQEGLAAALTDARTLDKTTAYATRYLDLTHLPQKDFEFYSKVLTLHVNLLSREATLAQPRALVNAQVLAIDLRDYAIETLVWERLIKREPYYHETRIITEYGPATTAANQYGQQVQTKGAAKTVRKVYPARHLPPKAIQELYALTYSEVPVVLGDWFFAMTAVAADRGGIGQGFGYYDFLGMKNRGDYFKLIGFDEKDWRGIISEIGAVVLAHNSGVAQNDRLVVRRGAVDGWAWFTLDFFDSNRDERNPLAILDRDKGLKHQAERHFGRLPNGLPVVIACDEKGVLQETAPDKIGPDTTAHGNDKRIHSSKSCLSCHSNGFLKDVPDEVRAIYTVNKEKGYNLLTSPVKEEQLKLQRIYLRDMQQHIDSDRAVYARAVQACNGQDVKTACGDYREGYERYILEAVTAAQVASGVGLSPEDFTRRLLAYRSSDPLASHVLAALSVGRPITRTNYEALYPLLQQLTRGVALP
jgi:hypothetical protein